MKYSKQREIILKVVADSEEHPTAEMVYQTARKILPNISLGTVYRNLNTLYENGMIKHIPMPESSDRFDKTIEDHYHMYCLTCKKMFDVPNQSLKEIDSIVSKETGYRVVAHNLVFSGVCNQCQRKE